MFVVIVIVIAICSIYVLLKYILILVSSINDDSGAWLMAKASPKMFEMSNSEFVSAICRRNTVEDLTIPMYTELISREDVVG